MVYNNRGYAKTHYAYFGFDSGYTVAQQQHYRAAIDDFEKAISLNPEDISAYANRGYAKTLLGHSKFDSGHAEEALRHYYVALEDFDEVISVNSEFPAYAERGAVRVSLGISETHQGHTQRHSSPITPRLMILRKPSVSIRRIPMFTSFADIQKFAWRILNLIEEIWKMPDAYTKQR